MMDNVQKTNNSTMTMFIINTQNMPKANFIICHHIKLHENNMEVNMSHIVICCFLILMPLLVKLQHLQSSTPSYLLKCCLLLSIIYLCLSVVHSSGIHLFTISIHHGQRAIKNQECSKTASSSLLCTS
jgi:hypothetical protein